MAKRTKQLTQVEEKKDEIRINKYLSEAGACSRREADVYIEQGKVMINGEVASIGSKVKKGDHVTLLGKTVTQEEKLAFIVLNKPRGIVCTTDLREPDNIIDFVNYKSRIFPIGRLDKDSEGLILLTNDGNIVNKILRAEHQHEKEYVVQVNKPITDSFLEQMASGVPILDTVTKPCEIKQEGKDVFRIILTQGLNRQIRRMCEYLGYRVLRLQRVRIMNVTLGRLKEGCYRNVTEKELEGMMESIRESAENKGKKRVTQAKVTKADKLGKVSGKASSKLSSKVSSKATDQVSGKVSVERKTTKNDTKPAEKRYKENGPKTTSQKFRGSEGRSTVQKYKGNERTENKRIDHIRTGNTKTDSIGTESRRTEYKRTEEKRKEDRKNVNTRAVDSRKSNTRTSNTRWGNQSRKRG